MNRDEAPAPTSHEDIMRAVNAGADLVLAAMSEAGTLNDAASNVSNLVVSAIGTVLEKPDATIVDVLADSFPGSAGQWREEFGDDVVDKALGAEDFDASSIEADPMAAQRRGL